MVARRQLARRRRPRGHGGRAVARQHRSGAARPDRAAAAQPARPGWWRPSGAARRRRSPDRTVRGGATSPSPTGPATPPSERTATARCPGDWNAAAEQITARASDRASSSGPQISMRSNARRSTAAGRFGCTRWTARNRCRADAAAGSTWSIGAESGGTSSSESGWLHSPYRTWRNSGWVTVCSQTRERSSARAGRAAGRGAARAARLAAARRHHGRSVGPCRGSADTRGARR